MDKAKALIFGMGITGQNLYKELMSNSGEKYDVIGFVDNFLYHKSKNDKSKDNEKMVVYEPKELKFIDFDVIFIATLSGFYDVISQLKELGIPEYKMDKTYVLLSVVGRENFLKNFKILVDKQNLKGAVAEVGVFRGDFAKIINGVFAERNLYLFDTFEGFSEKDLSIESDTECKKAAGIYFDNTSEGLVLSKMSHKEKIIIKKGYFPETVKGVECLFCFVNLDLDLYQPTLEGLRFFYPKMVEGGIILVHDFFGSHAFDTVKQAIYDYEAELGTALKKMPIGDNISIAIVK